MQHNRMFPYLAAGAVVAAVLIAVGAPLTSLLPFVFVLACPLMMVFMMRGMAGSRDREDHTGHGCEHDPTGRKAEAADGPRR
jgi:Flp pilus assembly protein TadB